MGYNYNFSKTSTNSQVNSLPKTDNSFNEYVKVVDIVLDSLHPDYNNSLDIGKIKYQILASTNTGFAYAYSSNINVFPVTGEIVELVQAPSVSTQSSDKRKTVYYKTLVNIFNQSNENKLSKTQDIANTQKGNLLPFSGDLVIQGRFGQSFRMSGTYLGSEVGDSITIIKNGQEKYAEFSLENINTDHSSIYLTSNHVIDLDQSFIKNSTYTQSPSIFKSYKGKQILFNSDRIGLNARKDDVIISSPVNIGLMSKSINLEGEDRIGLDADKIFLGKETVQIQNPEPATLGNKNKQLLQTLIDTLSEISNTLVNINAEPDIAVNEIKSLGAVLQFYINNLNEQLPGINSKKVFIDSGI
jgi:hypothetical protein